MPAVIAAGGGAANRKTALQVWVQAPPVQQCLNTRFRSRTLPADATLEIADAANTFVSRLADVYTVTKTGASGVWDASARGIVALTGDFQLRLEHSATSGTPGYIAGVANSPGTDNTESIDFAWQRFALDGNWYIVETVTVMAGPLADATYAWIWRSGTTLGYGRGASLAAAQASPDRTVTTSATLYFDSSLYSLGDEFKARLTTEAPAVNTYTATVSGGIVLAGTSANARVPIPVPSGGLVLAGTAGLKRTRVGQVSGGLQFAGTATARVVRTYAATVSGGITFGGAGVSTKIRKATVSGGIQFAGAATSLKIRKPVPSGGLVFSGTAAPIKLRVPLPAGGIQLDGSAAFKRIKTATVAGGYLFGGSATYSLTSGPNTYTAPAPTGGLMLAGVGYASRTRVGSVSGGWQFGGSATASFLPGVVTITWTYAPSGGIQFAGSAATYLRAVIVTPTRRMVIRIGDLGQSNSAERSHRSGSSGRSYRSSGGSRAYSSRRGR